MNILAFGFQGNISEEVLTGLDQSITKYVVMSEATKINDFISRIDFASFDYVLGMGMYTGVDTDRLRIETVYTSQFRNDKGFNRKTEISPFLHENEQFKITRKIGNSYCNLVCYLFTSKYTKVPYSFLHIPKTYGTKDAIDAINNQLATLD